MSTLSYIRSPNYRPDIDGLRAVAVVFVVLCHYFSNIFPGGFVGVDVFFVISGYLISSIIFRQLSEGRFSFLEFYAKRVRRIFPALLTVGAGALLIGAVFLTSQEYDELASHGFYGSIFIENLRLARGQDYFGLGLARNPFMHLWSLGVEEQFYFLFPLLCVLFWKLLGGRIGGMLLLLTAASFAFCLYCSGHDQSQAYFLPHSRFWQLGVGVLLSWMHFRALRGGWAAAADEWACRHAQALAFAGSAALLIPVFAFGAVTEDYPGVWALFPTLGAVCLIAGRNRSTIASWLAQRPVVYVGWLSYPLYLWHWVLLSVAFSLYSGEIPTDVKLFCIGLSVGFSVLTFEWVETPIRRLAANGRLLCYGLLLLVVLAAAFGWVHKQDGLPERLSEEKRVMDALVVRGYNVPPEHVCREVVGSSCWTDAGEDQADVIMIGNSHAEHFIPSLMETAPRGLNVDVYGAGGAFPLWNWVEGYRTRQIARSVKMHDVLRKAEKSPARLVIVSNTWSGDWSDHELPMLDGSTKTGREALSETIEHLLRKDRKIVFLVDNPGFPVNMETCLSLRPVSVGEARCTIPREVYERDQEGFRKMMAPFVEAHPGRILLVELGRVNCDEEVCSMKTKEGLPKFVDTNHYTAIGSKEASLVLWRELEPVLKELGLPSK